jgi:Glycosyltransferase family 87/WD40-like Beta Propeller Repeat
MTSPWEMQTRLQYSESTRIDPVFDGSAHHPSSGLSPKLARWLRICEWVLIALLSAHFGARTVPKAWQTLNTDFPNYYLTATLAHQHYDTSRVYDWIWIERQKDHRDIDQRVVGMVPITAFSTLVLYPLTGLSALAAKHCWLIFNFGLLLATLSLLRSITQLSWRRIILVAALSFPLRVNFLFGQYYVLLLSMLTLACYLYLRQRRFLAGIMVGIAAGLKVFPILYLLYFFRKRDWKALAGGVAGGLFAAVVSLLAFGWQLNRTYLFQVLPATLRGEGLGPYSLQTASLSSLLHRLFVYEPQLNQHPAVNAAWLFAVFQPLLQMAVMAPALLLAVPGDSSSPTGGNSRLRLEWAAILLASLAISTSPASYLFTLLILPACVLLETLERKRPYTAIAILLPLYVAAGRWSLIDHGEEGWSALLRVPRLYALILLCVLAYALLMRHQLRGSSNRERGAWAVALLVVVAFGIWSSLRHQRGLYDDYRWRTPLPKEVLIAAHSAIQGNSVLFVALQGDGYHSAIETGGVTQFSAASHDDLLAVSAAQGEVWVEQTGHESAVVSTVSTDAGKVVIPQAESPVASFDGRWLAFMREDHGRARVWMRALEQGNNPNGADKPVTPPELNVLEMSFLPSGELVFAADSGGRPGLFTTERSGSERAGSARSLGPEEARYPAVSPDGHWLAFSQLEGGNWNLWLRDLNSGQTQRLTHAACNAMDPAWADNSKTLVYASDCGRGLWFSALCRRRVIP